jgi:transcriptional regulator with XRE-family HTH domain/KaiC/GvpD/RAD55 family RecA-like ATPase
MTNLRAVSSGIEGLDTLLGGVLIGDNVIWYDDAGSLATVFCHRFLEASLRDGRPVIYVSFDRSPRNLLDRLGNTAQHRGLIVLDCFTFGKGRGSPTFLTFYERDANLWPCRIERLDTPEDMNAFMERLYGLHAEQEGDVRFIFESITGMQELWGGEDILARFYTHSCPRLYELNTVAYWIMEKKAHSPRLRAQLNQIAQVVIELNIKRGTTTLTVVKAERREVESLGEPVHYWTKGAEVVFEHDGALADRAGIGRRLKNLRIQKGLSQTELGRLVGLTPSSISQVESNLIYPSIPALLKMAEVLQVPVGSFFGEEEKQGPCPVLTESEASILKPSHLASEEVTIKLLTPLDRNSPLEPYLVELAPGAALGTHFFRRKGTELGYVLEGSVAFRLEHGTCTAQRGDLIHLTSEIPSQWRNTGSETARLLWVLSK